MPESRRLAFVVNILASAIRRLATSAGCASMVLLGDPSAAPSDPAAFYDDQMKAVSEHLWAARRDVDHAIERLPEKYRTDAYTEMMQKWDESQQGGDAAGP